MVMTADPRLRRITAFCVVHGFLFVAVGILSGIGLVVATLIGKIPASAGPAPILGAALGSGAMILFGTPGVLAFFFRKDHRARRFVLAAGIVLVLHIFLLPGFLPGPFVLPLVVLALASSGVWVLLTVYAVKLENEPGPG